MKWLICWFLGHVAVLSLGALRYEKEFTAVPVCCRRCGKSWERVFSGSIAPSIRHCSPDQSGAEHGNE